MLSYSSLPPGDQLERVRAFSRDIEFDYISWTLDAIGVKLVQSTLDVSDRLPEGARRQVVLEYLGLVARISQAEDHLNEIYANPGIVDPQNASALVRGNLEDLHAQRALLEPLAESILQSQISDTVAGLGLTLGGQPIPPVLYHSTPLPTALIVSPRDTIRQDQNISLKPDMSVDERTALEEKVDRTLNVSSLVVNVGGIGVYPTMVIQSSDLNYLSEVVAHEWVHNFLTFRPLGISYLNSPELRTMNETTASIAGVEIGRSLLERYYPELLPPPPPPPPTPGEIQPPPPPVFDFREEMRITRETVDQLLSEGKIEQAEDYMESRRVFFWENGYRIRKLNQAYFAFYGAYADQPGGAAGEDPVGAAVRALRSQSLSLADFLNRISWMSSFEQLKKAVSPPG
ncbi:MAG: hypothetical protein A2Z45_10245 [Chloroflexi bacterium RBG_19FT_COMBO_55_16]|nr:MAG: hypothetical protein A2Z45_10245 [Chloroflexi bacterium RBG_19FT_COMBO_55_16]